MGDAVKQAPKPRVISRGPKEKHKHGVRMPLRMIREAFGKTQVEVAKASGMLQGDVSKLESRDDALVSTLQRYAEALGGKLEVVIVGPMGHRMIVDAGGVVVSGEAPNGKRAR